MTTTTKPLTLLPEYLGHQAVLTNQEPGNRKRYTVEGFPSYFQGRHYRVGDHRFAEPYISVTKILDESIPKPALVPWARNMSLEAVRETLYDNPNPQFLGQEPRAEWDTWIDSIIEAARNRPDAIRDEAAEWGTGAHKAIQTDIECFLTGTGGIPEPMRVLYQPTLDAFHAFEQERNIQWIATELAVWDTETHTAGTVDVVGRLPNGHLWVGDWKTGNAIYKSAAIQVSAYATMIEQLYGETVDEVAVVRFPREQPEQYGDTQEFEIKQVDDIPAGWQAFLNCVAQAQYMKAKIWRE
jgi:hypothetical protein